MEVLGRIVWAGFWAIVAGFAAFVLSVVLTVQTDTCDPALYICDLAPIAGIGFGMLVGAIVAGITGWQIYGRMGRGAPSDVAPDV
jgi:hypothetical protein